MGASSSAIARFPNTVDPFPTPRDAVNSILDHLATLGLGRWELLEPSDVGPRPPSSAMALVVDQGTRWLRPDGGELEDLPELQRATVVAAARVIATLLAVESSATRASEHAARAERESETDELTGVANARAWWRTLARMADLCEARDQVAVVAVIDVDGLKQVNDEQGHLAGDDLLRRAATALQGALREGDLIARVGGDEFAVLVVTDDAAPQPEHIARRLRSRLADAGLRASVGTACFEAGDRINEVFHRADREMYRVKRDRRNSPSTPAPG